MLPKYYIISFTLLLLMTVMKVIQQLLKYTFEALYSQDGFVKFALWYLTHWLITCGVLRMHKHFICDNSVEVFCKCLRIMFKWLK